MSLAEKGGCKKYFNPLPRKEGDDFSWLHCNLYLNYFNPLPRKEGDVSLEEV